MYYTRKQLLRNALRGAVTFALPPILLSLMDEDERYNIDLLSVLEKHTIVPDLILLDDSSGSKLDYLGFKYFVEEDDAPRLCMDKNIHNSMYRQQDYTTELLTVRRYASDNKIFIYSNNEFQNETIMTYKKLSMIIATIRSNCSVSKIISESVFFPVSLMYAACIKYQRSQCLQTDLSKHILT